jgi:hypothetical protein
MSISWYVHCNPVQVQQGTNTDLGYPCNENSIPAMITGLPVMKTGSCNDNRVEMWTQENPVFIVGNGFAVYVCTLFWHYRCTSCSHHKSLATVVDLQSGKLKNKNFQGSVGVHSTLLLSVNNPRVWNSLFNPIFKACPRANLIPREEWCFDSFHILKNSVCFEFWHLGYASTRW